MERKLHERKKRTQIKYADKTQDRRYVTALSRGIAVLRCFNAQRDQLGTSEIAQLTGLPQATVWRMCFTLQHLGCLVPVTGSEKLRVGMGILGLGLSALHQADVGDAAEREMKRIAKATGAAVSLGIFEQDDILIIKRALGDTPLVVNNTIGSRLPISTTAMGWAYLVTLEEAQRNELLARLKYQYKGSAKQLHKAFEKEAAQFKSTGFVQTEGFLHPEVKAVGTPVQWSSDGSMYYLSCGGPGLSSDQLRMEIGPQLALLAAQISAALGQQYSNSNAKPIRSILKGIDKS